MIDLSGLAALDQLAKDLPGIALQAVQAAAAPVLAEAQRLAPVLTGATKHALQTRTERTTTGARAHIEVADSGDGGAVRQAFFTEYGHMTRGEDGHARHVNAKPFMRPALASKRDAAVREASAVVARHIKDFSK